MHFAVGRVGPVVFPEVKVGVLCPCIVREVAVWWWRAWALVVFVCVVFGVR